MTPSAKKIVESYHKKPEIFWIKTQNEHSQRLFVEMAKKVPAYRQFLKQNNFAAAKVNSPESFLQVPFTNKASYYRQFGIKPVSWPDSIDETGLVITSTSGSTGNPTYFGRGDKVDWQYSVLAEFFLQNGPKGSTLLIDCFGMGIWVGGLITYQAFRYAALRGWPVTVITPGINKKEIFHCLRELAPQFKNVILAGYPPFIKDVLDEAQKEGINFTEFRTRLLFAAESFTENFRDHVVSLAKVKDAYHDTLNIYGSAELGAMAFETPLSIFIRREALQHPQLYRQLFGNHRIPTLAQYNPEFVSFTEENGEILITANSTTPFMKYKIGDNGGTFTLSQIERTFKEQGLDLRKLATKSGIKITTLPFVYVYERSDLSTTLYGLQIYPQTIKHVLEQATYHKYFTGKFTLETYFDQKSNQFLLIHVETKSSTIVPSEIKNNFRKAIIGQLLETNSEFRELTKMLSIKRTQPKIVYWPYNHEKHFKSGIKQAWIKK